MKNQKSEPKRWPRRVLIVPTARIYYTPKDYSEIKDLSDEELIKHFLQHDGIDVCLDDDVQGTFKVRIEAVEVSRIYYCVLGDDEVAAENEHYVKSAFKNCMIELSRSGERPPEGFELPRWDTPVEPDSD